MKKLFLALFSCLLILHACNAEKTSVDESLQINGIVDAYIASGDINRFENFVHQLQESKQDWVYDLNNIKAYLTMKKEYLLDALSKKKEEQKKTHEEWHNNNPLRSMYTVLAVIAGLVGTAPYNLRDKDIAMLCNGLLYYPAIIGLSYCVKKRYCAHKDSERVLKTLRNDIKKGDQVIKTLDVMIALIQETVVLAS